MAKFVREKLVVDGVETVLYIAGKGDPVVIFHGAGTVDGFDFAEPWTEKFRVIVPYHPGFGESGDEPSFTETHDYVMHYLELFDQLGLEKVSIVGLSFGAYLAAKIASEHDHRLKKLVLIAPYGMNVEKYPMTDTLAVPVDKLLPMLVSNFEVLKKRLPEKPDIDFIAARYREATTFARLMWERPFDSRLPRYLHRVKVPTLLVWGEEDKITPVQHAEVWKKGIPQAEVRIVKGAGHLVQLEKPEVVEEIARFLGSGVV